MSAKPKPLSGSSIDDLVIRSLAPGELSFCLELAAAEGWNPGLHDAAPFAAADPDGYFVAEVDGEKIGCISAVRYPPALGFIGFYILRPAWRGRGYGLALWERALSHLAGRTIGLDGVPARRADYERSGFVFSYSNVRYQSDVRRPRDRFASAIALEPIQRVDDELRAYDLACFGAPRDTFLSAWLAQPETVARAARSLTTGELLGYAVARECREGTKVGPLFASRNDVGGLLYDTVAGQTRSPWFLDVPRSNPAGIGFAHERDMTPIFETARMWRGAAPRIALERVYGVTSFELG